MQLQSQSLPAQAQLHQDLKLPQLPTQMAQKRREAALMSR